MVTKWTTRVLLATVLWCGVQGAGSPAHGQGILDRMEALRERMRSRLEESRGTPPLQPPPGSLTPRGRGAEQPREAGTRPLVLGVELAEQGLRPPFRLVVRRVTPGMPAARAGVQAGDVLLQLDGRPVGLISEVTALLRRKRPGEALKLDVERAGRRESLQVQFGPAAAEPPRDPAAEPPSDAPAEPMLGARPNLGDGETAPASAPRVQRAAPGSGRLGVTVENVASAAPGEGVPVRIGAVVVAVDPSSPASELGIESGDVIVALDGVFIGDAESLIQEVSKTRPGQRVEVTFYQGRELKREKVELAARPGTPPPGRPAGEGTPSTSAALPSAQRPARPNERSSGGLFDSIGGALGGLLGGSQGSPPAAASQELAEPPAEATTEALPPPAGADPPPSLAETPGEAAPTRAALEAELEELRDQVKVLQQRITELQSALDERP